MNVLPLPSASPRRPFTRRAGWVAVLALSPLAYLGSFYLVKMLPSRNSVITINRERAIQAALQFAETRHIDARGWATTVGASQPKDVAVVLPHVRPPALDQVTAAAIATVRFRSSSSDQWFRALLTPTGRVVGFSGNEPEGNPAALGDAAAEAIAVSFLRDFLGPSAAFELKTPKMHFVNQKKQHRMYEWQAPVPGLAEAKAAFRVELAGDRVIAEGCDVTVESAYLKQFRPARILYQCWMVLAVIYLVAIGIHAIVRYVRRTSEKEVSHRRTVLVALVFVAFSVVAIYYGAAETSMSANGEPPTSAQRAALLGLFVFLFSLVGAFFGMAYGAGEGDVRAVYPGKLTSLDALLSGKLFSRNVARSILAGGAFAGAMLLVQNLALLVTHALRPVSDHDIVGGLISPFPLGETLSDTSLNALAIAGFGLLVPIAFLRPRVRKEWIFYALLPLFSMLSASIWASDSSAWRNFLITMLVSVAATCVPFFYGDLLASVSSIVALDLVAKLFYRAAASEPWAQTGAPVLYVGIAFLLVEVYFAERGKTYEEWEVRPLYARHLAERLSLQAEIGAARQAQLRLMPDGPPRIAGLSIAGSCVPAREVGGDFYDYYPLDDHRLGVFVAEGGNRELASAMPIALAKGYLLYTARLDLSPVEVLRRLRDLLGATLHDEGASVSMLYAVVDARAATLRFARTGVSPRLAINGNRAIEEVAVSLADDIPIQHGGATLQPGDALVFYTDGLAAQIADKKREPVDRFLAKTAAQMRDGSAAGLHSAILKAAIRRKNEPPLDDVTAVVIRLEEPGERALEVVA
jgi:serine phosphatase RsbU (regulator of sigma subunit)